MQLWIDPTFGASGDMLLGAFGGLLDDPLDALAPLQRLGIDGYEVSFETVVRCGLSSTRAVVVTDDHHHDHHDHDDDDHEPHDHRPHRRWSDIDAMLAGSDLPDRVVAGARSTFRLLGEVEAAQHDVPIDDVQFHEVGAVDAIVDIVGAWLLFEKLRSGRSVSVTVGPVGLGHGVVKAAHGLLPLPAPATVALLKGKPTRPLDAAFETCTPTGAALLVSMADGWGPLPGGSLGRSARGAGGKDPAAHPNVVTAILVETAETDMIDEFAVTDQRVVLETNVDDVSPEVLGHVIDEALRGGADDAWITPILMKKGRPAHEVKVLCRPELAALMVRLLMVETGTLGVRSRLVDRHAATRHTTTVEVHGHEVRVKVGPFGAKPEHDDLVRVAEATGRPLRQVAADAAAAFRRA